MFDQLNLFGDAMIKVMKKEEEGKSKEKEKGDPKVTSTSTKGDKGQQKKLSTPAKKTAIKVFGDWTIHYYGNSFTVAAYVDDIPETGIDTETLREAMAQEFFEMTKDRTTFDYDAENKRLFPKVSGGAKG